MRTLRMAGLLLVAMVATACVNSQSASNGAVRIINAVQDGPLLNLAINGTINLQNVDYPLGTAYVAIGAGTYDLTVQQILPEVTVGTSNPQPLFDLPGTGLAVNDELTIVMVGRFADSSVDKVFVRTTTTAVPAGQTRLQFFNASPDHQSVDVFVTAPDADLTLVDCVQTPLSCPALGLAYKANTDQQLLTSGTYQIRVTAHGDRTNVLFDSGPAALAREADLLYAVVDYAGPDSAQHPLQISLLTGISAGHVLDKNVRAALRFVHASAVVPPANLSVTLKNVTTNDPAGDTDVNQLTGAIPFAGVNPGPTSYVLEPVYSLIGTPAVYTTRSYTVTYANADDASAAASLTATGSFIQGNSATLIFAGTSTAFSQLSMTETVRSVFTEARVRLMHAAESVGAVDIYVTAPNADLTTSTARVLSAVFGRDTGYIALTAATPTDYEITLTAAGTPGTIVLQKTITVSNGGRYEAVLVSPTSTTSDLVPLDDFPAGP